MSYILNKLFNEAGIPGHDIEDAQQTAFNDPEALRLWEEYLLGNVPERKREALTRIWRQSGSPYRKEHTMSNPDELFRALFTSGDWGAPDTLHTGDYGGIHDTVAELTHAYQYTHPELEDIDLYGDTSLNLLETPPSLDYSYRRGLDLKSSADHTHSEWVRDNIIPNVPLSVASIIGAGNYHLGGERMERYDEEGTLEGEAHGRIETAMYDYYDDNIVQKQSIYSEDEWRRILKSLVPILNDQFLEHKLNKGVRDANSR